MLTLRCLPDCGRKDTDPTKLMMLYLVQDGLDPKGFRAMAVHIFLTYIRSRRIKVITAAQRKKIKKTITTPGKKLPVSIYDEVQKVVFDVVFNGVYARYLASNNSANP